MYVSSDDQVILIVIFIFKHVEALVKIASGGELGELELMYGCFSQTLERTGMCGLNGHLSLLIVDVN